MEPQKTDLPGRKKGNWTGILFLTKLAWFHKDLLHSTTNLLFFIFQNPIQEGDDGVLKKGLLWQQRDKLFSRWKERYFILTKDYFHCFKKATSRITEMGGFIFKVLFFLLIHFLARLLFNVFHQWQIEKILCEQMLQSYFSGCH